MCVCVLFTQFVLGEMGVFPHLTYLISLFGVQRYSIGFTSYLLDVVLVMIPNLAAVKVTRLGRERLAGMHELVLSPGSSLLGSGTVTLIGLVLVMCHPYECVIIM